MHREATSAGIMRRLMALERIPLFTDLAPSVLGALAEQVTEIPVTAGMRLPLDHAGDVIHFFPEGVDCELLPSGSVFAAQMPALLPWLAGEPFEGWLVARDDTTALAITGAHFAAALEDEFALFMAIARATAAQVIAAQQEARVAVALADAMARFAQPTALPEGLDLPRRLLLLRSFMPFARDQVSSLVQLARAATELRADQGVELWRKGDPADHALYLVSGAVRARIGGNEGFVLRPGSMLGGFDALAGRARWFTAVADTSVVALSLSVERFLDVLEDESVLARAVLGALARMLLLAWRTAASITEPDAEPARKLQSAFP